ncbi:MULTISPECIES: exodeoxyribonuclease VII large subunit [unclassified Agarivorans]|uniref:exodeoxyribonuclease VII large subunit n=1 Tax=unclassified Agarivorans TaxID=2636026 RepID=UPI003D7E5DEF
MLFSYIIFNLPTRALMQANQITQNVFSVSQLNQEVRRLLERCLGTVWLEGEISNFSAPFSGHWYFNLKDSRSQVRCAMFKNTNRKVLFKPESGMQVLVKANITMYEPRGDYQLIIEAIHPAGDGAIQQAFEQLKYKLAAQGLFAEAAKQALPEYPSTVGVVSSASGAALQDILSVLARRAPAIKVIVYPAAVQGEQAAIQICAMIERANQRQEVDLLIVGRGGGSKEDLSAFNDERLANCIFNSNLPIISAVGHEIDHSISDLVADVRAATPSAAAEIVSQQASHIEQRLSYLNQQLNNRYSQLLKQQQWQLTNLQQRIYAQSPEHVLQQQQQRFDHLSLRLERAMSSSLAQANYRYNRVSRAIIESQLPAQLTQQANQFDNLLKNMSQIITQQQARYQQQLIAKTRQLDALSPLRVLERGFTMVSHKQQLVHHAAELQVGDEVTLQFVDGQRKANISS